MPFTGFANPEQLQSLTTALDEYCRANDIRPGTPAHEDAAWHIMAMFNSGVFEPEGIVPALQASPIAPSPRLKTAWRGRQR